MAASKHDFRKNETDLFLCGGLDWQISHDAMEEIGMLLSSRAIAYG